MKLEFKGGLLFTSIQISFRGKSKIIDNIVVDTGAAESIISPDAVEDIGIYAELEDSVNSFYGVGGSLHNFFMKNVTKLTIDDFETNDVKLDFGIIDPKGKINGLLGLDILMNMGAVLDLEELAITRKRK